MKTVLFFVIFLAMLLASLFMGVSVAWPMIGGLALFFVLGLTMGYKPGELWRMAWEKGKKSLIVVRILVLIGMITGLWRASGTIAYCIYYGIQIVTPKLFVVVTFLLTAAMSYLLGTSFGVSSTVGVIFMALARFGGVNEAVAAGAILSGVYFGDRCSPASSSASLVAAVTDTDLYQNIRLMLKTSLLPTVLTVLIYLFLSFCHPITGIDIQVLGVLSGSFRMSWLTLLPAIAMLVLPLCRIPIYYAMAVSILIAAAVACLLQGFAPAQLLEIAVLGYQPQEAMLASVLSGGGLVSMSVTYVIVMATGMYSGILEGIGILRPLEDALAAVTRRFGRLPVMLVLVTASIMVFCNQTVAAILMEQLLRRSYDDKQELAMDIENTGITIAGLVPWAIACSVPLTMLGADVSALPYAVLLWLIPLCWVLTKRWFYPEKKV